MPKFCRRWSSTPFSRIIRRIPARFPSRLWPSKERRAARSRSSWSEFAPAPDERASRVAQRSRKLRPAGPAQVLSEGGYAENGVRGTISGVAAALDDLEEESRAEGGAVE